MILNRKKKLSLPFRDEHKDGPSVSTSSKSWSNSSLRFSGQGIIKRSSCEQVLDEILRIEIKYYWNSYNIRQIFWGSSDKNERNIYFKVHFLYENT